MVLASPSKLLCYIGHILHRLNHTSQKMRKTFGLFIYFQNRMISFQGRSNLVFRQTIIYSWDLCVVDIATLPATYRDSQHSNFNPSLNLFRVFKVIVISFILIYTNGIPHTHLVASVVLWSPFIDHIWTRKSRAIQTYIPTFKPTNLDLK